MVLTPFEPLWSQVQQATRDVSYVFTKSPMASLHYDVPTSQFTLDLFFLYLSFPFILLEHGLTL